MLNNVRNGINISLLELIFSGETHTFGKESVDGIGFNEVVAVNLETGNLRGDGDWKGSLSSLEHRQFNLSTFQNFDS